MSVLKDSRSLILGNGDLFLASSLSALPSLSSYKAALASGGLGVMAGNVGAVKGTVTVQIVREMVRFEIGVPQEVADQTCIREGIHLKCSLAELSLATVKTQIGGGVYATQSAGAQHFTGTGTSAEIITLYDSAEGDPIAQPIKYGPVLFTGSTPAAGSNPVVKDSTETTTYTIGTDYQIDPVTNTIIRLTGGTITANQVIHLTSYYYNQNNAETLSGGGQADVIQSAVRFFHPYKDGRALMFTMYQASPTGTTSLPFEEIAYSHAEFEMMGIADFTRASGDHLYSLYRDLPT